MQSIRRSSRQSGVTLIELMIVLVIIAILAAIAVPSYQDSVRKTWRKKANACLIEIAQGMERRYTAGLSYIADPSDLTLLPPQVCSTEEDMGSRYVFSLVAANLAVDTFTLQGVPQGIQASGDARCGTLTINHQGIRTASGGGTVDECW